MRIVCVFVACFVVVLENPLFLLAGEPLHEQIDQLIEKKLAGKTPAPKSEDAEFLRRVWLDLAGKTPSSEKTRRFLDDSSPDKRAKQIDRLLDAPTYARRLADLFHLMLMERLGDDAEWQAFLQSSFQQNKPWDQMAREILNPDPENKQKRGAAFFYTKRLEKYGQNPVDYPGLTRDVGRLFMGADLQCAQCHNHLFIDDYKQRDFQGLFAVYKNLSIRKGAKFPAVSEKAMMEKLEFVSVFDPTMQKTGPRIPFGKEFSLPELEKSSNNKKRKKKEKKKNESSFSALALIAEEMPNPENELFMQNIVNRLWFIMMGRGLVHPLDQSHSDNPPTHPQLLELLARDFAAHDFDIKYLLRELALTKTYQRSSILPKGQKPPPKESYLVANEKRLSAEQLFWSMLQATGNLERLRPSGEKDPPDEDFQALKKSFVKAFSNEPRTPAVTYNPTVKAALFLLNDDQVLNLLKPQEENLLDRLGKIEDSRRVTEELFLSIFNRRPTEDELSDVTGYLKGREDHRREALRQLAWAMLTSTEFCINH